MRNKTYRKDLMDDELAGLMQPHIDRLMAQVVPRQPIQSEQKPNTPPSGKQKASSQKDAEDVSAPQSTHQDMEYLHSIVEHPFLTITGRAEKLGHSSYMNDKIKKELLQKDLIQEFSINPGFVTRGNVKFLKLTSSGYLTIKKPPPKEPTQTCSTEHAFYQDIACRWYRRNGYRAEIEMNKNGKRADVGITKNNFIIALEFELTAKNAVHNVTADLSAGFQQVLLVCKNAKVQIEVKKKLVEVLTSEEWQKVKVLLLQDLQCIKEIFGKGKP